jgi:hypothetical protein
MNATLSWLLIPMYASTAAFAFPNAPRKQSLPMTKLMKNGLNSTPNRQKSARVPTNSPFGKIQKIRPLCRIFFILAIPAIMGYIKAVLKINQTMTCIKDIREEFDL